VFYGSKSVGKNGAKLLIRVAVKARAESVDEFSFRPEADPGIGRMTDGFGLISEIEVFERSPPNWI